MIILWIGIWSILALRSVCLTPDKEFWVQALAGVKGNREEEC